MKALILRHLSGLLGNRHSALLVMLVSFVLIAGCAASYSPVTGEAGSSRPFTQEVRQGQTLRVKLNSGVEVSGEFRGIVSDTLCLGSATTMSRIIPSGRTDELFIALGDIDCFWIPEGRVYSPFFTGLFLGVGGFFSILYLGSL